MRPAVTVSLAMILMGSAASLPGQLQGVPVADIDKAADACNDFDAYANGAWRASHPMPAVEVNWGLRIVAQEDTNSRLHSIAEDDSAISSINKDGSPARLVGDFYSACMNEAAINARGLVPLRPLVQRIDAVRDAKSLVQVMVWMQTIGIGAPVKIKSSQDVHQPTRMIADIGVAGLGLPDRDFYLRNEPRFSNARAKYVGHLAKMCQLAGMSEAAAKAAADAVIHIETRLAEARMSRVEMRDPHAEDHITTFAALQKMTPHLDWNVGFEALQIDKNMSLNVSQPEQIKILDELIASTPLEEWRAYLTWELLHAEASRLPTVFGDENFAFYGMVLNGIQEQRPRWQRCVTETDQQLGEALGHEYVDRFFPAESKARARQMAINIAAELRRSIETREWITDATRRHALEKVDDLNIKIGYPDRWKTYARVKIGRRSYLENTLSTAAYAVRDDLNQIGKPIDRSRWNMTPPTLNAYYNPSMNEIVVPAGYLQPPGFNPSGLDAVNYGAIGVTMGHEISHSVDDEGSQYAADGRLENWWTDADRKTFEVRTACTTRQYEGYFVEPGLHLNGKLVTGEALGDLEGVNLAYRAYERSRIGKGPEPTVDGYAPEQQFFLAEGQWRGATARAEALRTSVSTDPHPPGKFRVIGPLSNMPEFGRTFQCKAGAAMVRTDVERCSLW